MKKEKPQIGIRKAKPSDPKDLGVIKFGKSRPDKTKYVLVDIEYDKKAGKDSSNDHCSDSYSGLDLHHSTGFCLFWIDH